MPIYGFILPAALPSSLLNTYFFIHHNAPLESTPPTAATPPPAAHVEFGDFAPMSPGGQKLEVELKRNAMERADDESKGMGSVGGSSGSYTASGSAEVTSASSPRKGRPSEWAKTASQRF